MSELLEILTRRLLQSVPYTHHGGGGAGIHLNSRLLATFCLFPRLLDSKVHNVKRLHWVFIVWGEIVCLYIWKGYHWKYRIIIFFLYKFVSGQNASKHWHSSSIEEKIVPLLLILLMLLPELQKDRGAGPKKYKLKCLNLHIRTGWVGHFSNLIKIKKKKKIKYPRGFSLFMIFRLIF